MFPFHFASFLFLLHACWAEYLPPLKDVFENTEFREALIGLGQCRSHLYVCAYRLAQCVERSRGPSDPPSEQTLMQTVQRWGDAHEEKHCQKSLDECKKEYFSCDETAPDPGQIVDAAIQKHSRDRADLPSAKQKHTPLTDKNGDPVRDPLEHAEQDPVWDFDRQMPYSAQQVQPEKDPRLMAKSTKREYRRRQLVWATYLANCLPVLVIWIAIVLVRRSVRSFNVRFPRRLPKYGSH